MIIQAAGGTLLAAFILAIITLGWKNRAAYSRLVGWLGNSVLPCSLFCAGVVYGSHTPPQEWYISLGFVLAPGVLWVVIWSWGIVALELQGQKPFDRLNESSTGAAKRENPKEGSD